MANQTSFGNTDQTGSGSRSFEKAATTAKSVADQALSAGRDLKDKAIGLAGASSETIKDQTSEFVDAAKDVASQATDKLKQTIDGQKNAGADYVGSLADTLRRAAKEFDSDLPVAGAYIRKAASQFEGAADTIKTGNFNDLVRGAQSFARRQPAVFLGMAVIAGFGVIRFLNSSARDLEGSQQGGASEGAARSAAGLAPAGNKGYRDEFTK